MFSYLKNIFFKEDQEDAPRKPLRESNTLMAHQHQRQQYSVDQRVQVKGLNDGLQTEIRNAKSRDFNRIHTSENQQTTDLKSRGFNIKTEEKNDIREAAETIRKPIILNNLNDHIVHQSQTPQHKIKNSMFQQQNQQTSLLQNKPPMSGFKKNLQFRQLKANSVFAFRDKNRSGLSSDVGNNTAPQVVNEEVQIADYQQFRKAFLDLNSNQSISNVVNVQQPQAIMSILGSSISGLGIQGFSNGMHNIKSTDSLQSTLQQQQFLQQYGSKQGDSDEVEEQLLQDFDDNERKETEQLPLTKDLRQAFEYLSDEVSDKDPLEDFEEMSGLNEDERGSESKSGTITKNDRAHQVQKTIRKSIVKEKMNWSQQFNKEFLVNQTKNLESVNKLFMDSKGATSVVNALRGGHHKKTYQMSQNALLFDLSMANKDLKFITVNMLSKNLKLIDLQNNKIEQLPEEISDLMFLEKLKVDQNQLRALPKQIAKLQNLQTLTACNNQLSILPQGIETLSKLEILLVNDNKLNQLPARLGLLISLKKLFIHNNLLQMLPIEFNRLNKLKEFSLEWFIYLNPPMPKIMRDSKGLLIIDQVKSFCRSYIPPNISNSQALESDYRSFGDFILYFHQAKPHEINTLSFGIKQRSIVHQICVNAHSHLLLNLVSPIASSTVPHIELTSSVQIAKYIDLNTKDKEGTTPISLALRQNNMEIVDTLIETKKVDMNFMSSKYGCPLHLCILKHKFDVCLKMLENGNSQPSQQSHIQEPGSVNFIANPHITNSNGSNAIHILFANFSYDEENAQALLIKLIQSKVNLNLVDNNGLTPIHVSVKKNQISALQFAHSYNKSLKNQHLSFGAQQICQFFDFNAKGKKSLTPLHYVILKNNYEAFSFFLQERLSDIFSRDDTLRTPRGISLINSAFYKILYRIERIHVLVLSLHAVETEYKSLRSYQESYKKQIRINTENKSVDFNQVMRPQELQKFLIQNKAYQTSSKHLLSLQPVYFEDITHDLFNKRVLKHAKYIKPTHSHYNSLSTPHQPKTPSAIGRGAIQGSQNYSTSGCNSSGGLVKFQSQQKRSTYNQSQTKQLIESIKQGGIGVVSGQDNSGKQSNNKAVVGNHQIKSHNQHQISNSSTNKMVYSDLSGKKLTVVNQNSSNKPSTPIKIQTITPSLASVVKNNIKVVKNKNFEYNNNNNSEKKHIPISKNIKNPALQQQLPQHHQIHNHQQQQQYPNLNPQDNQPHTLMKQSLEKGVVNNIFISNLNINLNLNINISIPPSPKSTKGNISRIDTFQSIDDLKDVIDLSQNQQQKIDNLFKQRDSINQQINQQINENLSSQCQNQNPFKTHLMMRESINESVRNEDLSIIDDEMPIHNNINKNLKSKEYVQDIIEKIQPQISQRIVQSISMNSQQQQQQQQQTQQQQNIYISVCSINNPANSQPEDIPMSIKHTPRIINTNQGDFYLQNPDHFNNLKQQYIRSRQQINDTSVIQREYSDVLSEKSAAKSNNLESNNVNDFSSTVKKEVAAANEYLQQCLQINSNYVSDKFNDQQQFVNTQKLTNAFEQTFKANALANLNMEGQFESILNIKQIFDDEIQIVLDPSKPYFIRYEALYQRIAIYLNPQSMQNSVNEDFKNKQVKSAEALSKIIEGFSSTNNNSSQFSDCHSNNLKSDALYLLSQFSPNLIQGNDLIQNALSSTMESFKHTKEIQNLQINKIVENKIFSTDILHQKHPHTTLQSVNTSKNMIVQIECQNAIHIRENNKKIALQRYPSMSMKLNNYLKNQKQPRQQINGHHTVFSHQQQQLRAYKDLMLLDSDEMSFTPADTLEENFDITTDRMRDQKQDNLKILVGQEVISPNFKGVKQFSFDQREIPSQQVYKQTQDRLKITQMVGIDQQQKVMSRSNMERKRINTQTTAQIQKILPK